MKQQSRKTNLKYLQSHHESQFHQPERDRDLFSRDEIPKHSKPQLVNNKHCQSLVDLTTGEYPETHNNGEPEPKKKNKINQFLSTKRDHHCSVNENHDQRSHRAGKCTAISKMLQSSNNLKIQNITSKYFGGNGRSHHHQSQSHDQSNKNSVRSKQNLKNQTKYLYSICDQEMHTSSQKSLRAPPSPSPLDKHKQEAAENDHNYNLLRKLKVYIEELKNNEECNTERISVLEQQLATASQQNQQLKQQCRQHLRIQKEHSQQLKAMQIKQRQYAHKITQLKESNNSLRALNNQKPDACIEHELIIQSLKNVINQQLAKIIELEKNRLQSNSLMASLSHCQINNKNRNEEGDRNEGKCRQDSKNGNKLKQKNQSTKSKTKVRSMFRNENSRDTHRSTQYLSKQSESLCSSQQVFDTSTIQDDDFLDDYQGVSEKMPEVYSFKKPQKNEQESQSRQQLPGKEAHRNGPGKESHRNGTGRIPEPYRHIISQLKGVSSRDELMDTSKCSENLSSPIGNVTQPDTCSNEQEQESFLESQQSQDKILQQVGNYLSNIKVRGRRKDEGFREHYKQNTRNEHRNRPVKTNRNQKNA